MSGFSFKLFLAFLFHSSRLLLLLFFFKVAALLFPKREFFISNREDVAKHRRRLLELYLRRLFNVCTKIPQCPIYEGPGGPGLTRASLAQLSPFFKKGLFENGKHGTG